MSCGCSDCWWVYSPSLSTGDSPGLVFDQTNEHFLKDYVDLLDSLKVLMELSLKVRLWKIEKIWKQTDQWNLTLEYLVLEPCRAQFSSKSGHCAGFPRLLLLLLASTSQT